MYSSLTTVFCLLFLFRDFIVLRSAKHGTAPDCAVGVVPCGDVPAVAAFEWEEQPAECVFDDLDHDAWVTRLARMWAAERTRARQSKRREEGERVRVAKEAGRMQSQHDTPTVALGRDMLGFRAGTARLCRA